MAIVYAQTEERVQLSRITIRSNSCITTDKIAAWCGVIWLVSIMDVCYSWFFPWTVRYAIGSLPVFFATLRLSNVKGLVISRKRRFVLFSMLSLAAFMFVIKFHVFAPIKYGPMICIIFWRKSALLKMYKYFRNYIVFYAILSIFVELLVISGLYMNIPHLVFGPQDPVQVNHDTVNYFYGFFSIPTDGSLLTFYRVCGPVREGGHFAIFMGFIYFAEKAIYNRRNIWLIISGLLTLSPNFPLAFLITEGYIIIRERKYIKGVITLLGFIFIPIIGFIASPQSIKDEMVRVVMERSLESSLENAEDDGFMALIDGRTGSLGVSAYDSFKKKGLITRLKGTKFPEGVVLSDYRRLLITYGYIGTALILWCIVMLSVGTERNGFGLSLFLLALIIFLHRAWMFGELYHYMIMFLIINDKMLCDCKK